MEFIAVSFRFFYPIFYRKRKQMSIFREQDRRLRGREKHGMRQFGMILRDYLYIT